MKIDLQRIGDGLAFEATNEEGNTVRIDSAPDLGGTGEGARPMQLVAMGLGGCSSIDVLNILKKQRQTPEHYAVRIEAERRQDEVPSVFSNLHLHFELEGEVDPDKLRRAIELSLDKYCSVAAMLEQTATITYSFAVNGDRYD